MSDKDQDISQSKLNLSKKTLDLHILSHKLYSCRKYFHEHNQCLFHAKWDLYQFHDGKKIWKYELMGNSFAGDFVYSQTPK